MNEITVLSGPDVAAALPMPDAIEVMRSAFGELSRGVVELPQRVAVSAASGSMMLVMPGSCAAPFGLGAKMVSVFEGNPRSGLPLVSGVVLLLDRETGQPAALLDAGALTAIRTGAASGLATDLLAKADARCMAMLGAGAQARTQIAGVCAVREIDELRVWSRTRERASHLAQQVASQDWAPAVIAVVGTPAEAAAGADVVCTATMARVPIMGADDASPGMHLNAVGSFTAEMRELETGLMAMARVVVEHRPTAMIEAGEVIAAISNGALEPGEVVEIGEIVNGTEVGRTAAGDVTVFKSVGIAVQDLAAGSLAVERARELGLGTSLKL